MGIVQKAIENLRQRRDNVLRGNTNCIPSPFKSFINDFPGTEQETYYLITGMQKSAKTKFTSYVFLYNNLMYAYRNPAKVRLKIFYVPLEETPDKITKRFMSYLLFELSGHRLHVSLKELESVYEGRPVSEEVLNLLETDEYQRILQFFEDTVVWIKESNPTGIYKTLVKYAVQHGKRCNASGEDIDHMEEEFDSFQRDNVFDHYVPDDPNEYVEIITDHISLLSLESGMDQRATMKKYSSYMNEVKNKYRYIPVVIQQQSIETQDINAFKLNKIRPTASGLADCKDTKNDVNVMIGLTNPYYHEMKTYLGYNIVKLQDHQRFLEIVLSRDGEANAVKALYFDGAVNFFAELPPPDNVGFLEKVYNLIESLKVAQIRALSQDNNLMKKE